MRKKLKKYLVPCEDNDYKPHLLEKAGVIVLSIVVIFLFVLSSVQMLLLARHVDFLAAVLPSVLVDLANEDRVEVAELWPLEVDEVLQEAAQMKAEHMAENSYFAHISPDGRTPWDWMRSAGYRFVNAGENLAVNFRDSSAVEEAWMGSPLHRANILSRNYTQIGIATARGEYKGREAVFVVQMFGYPISTNNVTQTTRVDEGSLPTSSPVATSVASEEQSDEVLGVETRIDEQRSDELDTEGSFLAYSDESVDTENMLVQSGGVGAQDLSNTDAASYQQNSTYSSWVDRLLVQPSKLLRILYFVIAALVLLVGISILVIELRKHDLRNVGYAVLLVVLMLVLIYVQKMLLVGGVIVK